MSIATRIESIEGHISDTYDMLERGGTDLTNLDKNLINISPKIRERYLDFMNNGTDVMWNNWEKVTATDVTEASMQNTVEAPMKSVLKGNTSQETTTGYNLLPSLNTTRTINDVAFTPNADGSITVNGKASAITTYPINANSTTTTRDIVLSAGSYMVLDEVGNYTDYFTQVTDGSTFWANTGHGNPGVVGQKPFTISEQKTVSAIIYIRDGVTVNNVTFKPMIVAGSTVKTYEPYTGGIPSPNPSYPQDVEVVTGENSIKVQNKNLFPGWISGTVNTNTGEITSVARNMTDYIPIEQTQYTLWREDTGFATYFIEYDSNKAFIREQHISTGNTTGTFTPSTNCKYVILFQYTSYSPTNKAQLEYGSSSTSYIPHAEQTYPISLGSIELAKIGTYQDRFMKTSGKNLLDMSTLEIGKAWNNSSNSARAIMTMTCEPSTTYTVSATGISGFDDSKLIVFEKESAESTSQIANANVTTSTIITTNANTHFLALQFNKTGISSNDFTNVRVMVNKGSTALPYEPYGTGDWYKRAEIAYKTLNGTENWTKNTTYDNVFFTDSTYLDRNYSANVLASDHFTYDGVISSSSGVQVGRMYLWNTEALKGRIVIGIEKDTKQEVQTFFSTNNTKVYYVSQTTTFTQITDTTLINQLNAIEKAKSYTEQTNISQTNAGKPFIIDVTALKNV